MAERHMGFAPQREKVVTSDGLVVVNSDPGDLKQSLIEALEEARTGEPSLATDWNIDLLKGLIGKVEETRTILELLAICTPSGIILPGDEKAQEKKPLGFPLPH